MDPATSGLITAVGKETARYGIQQVAERWKTEIGAFWKRFEKELKNDLNVPWDEISGARVTPEFIGITLALIVGRKDAKSVFTTYFSALEPPEGAYEDKEWLQRRLLEVAEVAAAEAPKSDRLARLASERRTQQSVVESEERIIRRIDQSEDTFSERLDELEQKVEERAAGNDSLGEALREVGQSNDPAVSVPSPRQLEEQVARDFRDQQQHQHEENSRRLARVEELLERLTDAPGGLIEEPGTQAVAKGGDGDVRAPFEGDEKRVEAALGKLEEKDGPAAEQIRAVLGAHGAGGLVGLFRAAPADYTPAALHAMAEIVALEGFQVEASEAFLRAAEGLEDDREKAGELASASRAASAAGAEGEAAELLTKARELSPDHPNVLIAQAAGSTDGDLILKLLARAEPKTDPQRTALHVHRARAHLILGDPPSARAEVELAKAGDAENITVQEVEGMLLWSEARASISAGNPDHDLFLRAAEIYERVAEALRPRGVPNDRAKVLALGAQCFAIADRSRAIGLLEDVGDLDRVSGEVRGMLAEAATMCGRGEFVSRFAGGPGGDSLSRVAWAEGQILSASSSEAKVSALAILEEELDGEDEEARVAAAFALLAAAIDDRAVDWNERAAVVVGERSAVTLALFRAQHFEVQGDLRGAESELLPFGSDARALRLLRNYAASQEDWTKTRDRARELFKRSGRAADRLALADATKRVGEAENAREEFLAVAHEDSLEAEVRGNAFAGAVEIAADARDYEAVRELCSEWREALPEDLNATWNLIFALARLARHDQAYELVERLAPAPDTPQRAALLAEVLSRAAPAEVAIREIAALSDRYERKVEALEGMLINTALSTEEEAGQVPEELAERVREAISSFPERFPEQQFMQVFDAPSTREQLEEMLKKAGGQDRSRLQLEVLEEIIAGQQPVNTLAAITSGEIGTTWLRLGFLPLGFAMERADRADREAAETALGAGVVWDSSSIFITGGLGAGHIETVRGVFPGSQIPIETLEDADRADAGIHARKGGETVQDPRTGEFLGIRERDEEELARQHAMAEGMLSLARELSTAPPLDVSSDPELSEAYEENQPAWNAMVASLALARSSLMPLFSDDRWVREIARSMGVPAFGTLALIEVMAEQGVIDAPRRVELRRELSINFAWGVKPSAEELSAAIEKSRGSLTPYLRGALNDRAMWRAAPGSYMKDLVEEILGEACGVEEGDIRLWTRRIVDAFSRALPEVPVNQPLHTLLLFAWDVGENTPIADHCFRKILAEVGALMPSFYSLTEPLAFTALTRILEAMGEQSNALRSRIFIRVIRRLDLESQIEAFQYFVAPERS